MVSGIRITETGSRKVLLVPTRAYRVFVLSRNVIRLGEPRGPWRSSTSPRQLTPLGSIHSTKILSEVAVVVVRVADKGLLSIWAYLEREPFAG